MRAAPAARAGRCPRARSVHVRRGIASAPRTSPAQHGRNVVNRRNFHAKLDIHSQSALFSLFLTAQTTT